MLRGVPRHTRFRRPGVNLIIRHILGMQAQLLSSCLNVATAQRLRVKIVGSEKYAAALRNRTQNSPRGTGTATEMALGDLPGHPGSYDKPVFREPVISVATDQTTITTPVAILPEAAKATELSTNGNFENSIEHTRIRDEERSGATIANAMVRPQGQRPFYTGSSNFTLACGESTGFPAVLDIMAPEEAAAPKHILLPYNIPASLSSQERAYLDYKGCFTLPQNEICLDLLRAYFYHVHPLIPVVDAEEILKFLDSNANEYNLLLLWAMFFVAANCLYDNGGEMDKVVQLQAAVLLGFWHSKNDDHTQPWYWTGIAINLCYIMAITVETYMVELLLPRSLAELDVGPTVEDQP
ncbi:Transcription factor [Penicillium occitanis (nom. inval.)]|nr:Transcription factor [Penicillium occitanis (nom. inval.)]PCG91739.1 hypothetical protein PENOC_095940 [Penicillium occitanis (nom. inval.)]